MSRDLVIVESRSFRNYQEVFDRVLIHPEAEVIGEDAIEITAVGEIRVLGKMTAPPGQSITLTSTTGSIMIGGALRAGNGADGGANLKGSNGGNVSLVADRGEIKVAGELMSGAGGTGHGDINGRAAIGGNGGNAGNLSLKAKKIVIIGRLIGANGGSGGYAQANELPKNNQETSDNPRLSPEPVEENPNGVPNPPGPPLWDPKPKNPVPGDEMSGQILNATATGGNGGNGGQIHINCLSFVSTRLANIATGFGLDSGGATASGATTSFGYSGSPGNGGNFEFVVHADAQQAITLHNDTITLGSGGTASMVRAFATEHAKSTVENGGSPGQINGVSSTGLAYNKGNGGVSGIALAKSPNNEDKKPIRNNSHEDAGQGAVAEAD